MNAFEWAFSFLCMAIILLAVYSQAKIADKDRQIIRLNDDITRLQRELKRKENQ